MPIEVPADETLDAISGHFRIFQLRKGHRFSTDDLLTAWYGTAWAPSAGRVLDLGSGIGSVGMIAAWRLPGARFVTVEAQEESVRLARKSAAYNGLADRYDIRHADFRDAHALAPDERFDLVLASPRTSLSAPASKAIIRRRWRAVSNCAATSAITRASPPNICSRADSSRASIRRNGASRLESAVQAAGLTVIRRRPVIFREGEPPLVGLFGMMRAADLPAAMRDRTWIEPAARHPRFGWQRPPGVRGRQTVGRISAVIIRRAGVSSPAARYASRSVLPRSNSRRIRSLVRNSARISPCRLCAVPAARTSASSPSPSLLPLAWPRSGPGTR